MNEVIIMPLVYKRTKGGGLVLAWPRVVDPWSISDPYRGRKLEGLANILARSVCDQDGELQGVKGETRFKLGLVGVEVSLVVISYNRKKWLARSFRWYTISKWAGCSTISERYVVGALRPLFPRMDF